MSFFFFLDYWFICIEVFIVFSAGSLYFRGIGGNIIFIIFLCLFDSFFISLASGLSILLIFSNNLWIPWFYLKGCISLSCSFALILVLSCLLLAFEYVWSCSSTSFHCDFRFRVSGFDLSSFPLWAFSAINFPLDTALNVSQRFWYVVSSFYWFQITSLFLPSFHYIFSSHSGAVSM